jgi:hypothetical protein
LDIRLLLAFNMKARAYEPNRPRLKMAAFEPAPSWPLLPAP